MKGAAIASGPIVRPLSTAKISEDIKVISFPELV